MSTSEAEWSCHEKREASYENRAVAFLDILGWRQAVEDSVVSPELRRKLLNAVSALGALSKKDVEDSSDHPSFDQATQFSDSIVISIPYLSHLDLLRLIRQITSYQQTMLLLGSAASRWDGFTIPARWYLGPP